MVDSSELDTGETPPSRPTQLEVLDEAVRRLEAEGRTAPRRTAEWLLTEVLDCDRAQLYAHPERAVPEQAVRRFQQMVERRGQGEPLQHILGYTSFHGLHLQVSPDVMVPRPETEAVVERALAKIEGKDQPRILDVGTGSGCIALALKHERPNAVVYACDVSSDALAVAQHNAEALQLNVKFLEADLLADNRPGEMPGNVDLLVSNPPYIPDEEADSLPPVVRRYDPDVALFAGSDPLRFYRAIVEWARALCGAGGIVVLEVHAEYAEEVGGLLRDEGLLEVSTESDLSGRPRVVSARVAENQ